MRWQNRLGQGVNVQQPVDMPPPRAYGPWWPRLLAAVSVIAALVITRVTGVGVGIVLGAIAVAETAGIAVVTIVRVHRHKQPLRVAAAALVLSESDRRRLQERSRHRVDPADPSDRPS